MNLSQADLSKLADPNCKGKMQRARLIKWLRKNKIKFKYTADEKEIWTTQHQVDQAFEDNLEVFLIGQEQKERLSKAS